MKNKVLASLLVTGVLACAVSAPSHALPIEGGFSITPTLGGTVTTNFTTPTSLAFSPTDPTANTANSIGASATLGACPT